MMEEVEHHEVPSVAGGDAPTTDIKPLSVSSSIPTVTSIAQPVTNVVSSQQKDLPVEIPAESATSNVVSSDGGSWSFGGWLKSASSNQFVQKFMEKTKTGVDKMITTLDPGMAPYMKEGGNICVVVASDKEVKWGAVRDAFQHVFGTATVTGIAAQSNIAPQPVGYTSGMKGAQERIKNLRKFGSVDEKQLCVSAESFIVEQLPDHWFDVTCIVIDDPQHDIKFEVFTLAVPVENDIIADMQASTPSDYDLRWSGLAVTVGETIQKRLSWVKPSEWHRALTGQSRRDIIYSASLLLAELYKRRLPEKTFEQNV